MAKLQIPNKTPKNIIEYSGFKGIDLSNEPSNVAYFRSPNCLNMISDLTGKPVKRKGYRTILADIGRVWAIHVLETLSGRKRLVHADDKLFLWDDNNETTLLYTGMNEKRSVAFPMSTVFQDDEADFKARLWILDGKKYLVYDGTSVVAVDTVGYIPTTVITRTPLGGGEELDKVNLLSPYRINKFQGTADATSYQLDTTAITAVISAEKQDKNGNWVSAGEYSVNLATGVVTFLVAPGIPVIKGEDNVRIKFSKVVKGYADRINKCDIASVFGVNNFDTVFVAGNDEFPNIDFTSYFQKPNYFPDVNYSQVGQSNTKIMGYHRVTGYQAIVKEENGQDATVFLRSGTLKTKGALTESVFSIKQGTQGNGAVAKHAFLAVGSDNMFLSKDGVVALDNNAVSGERSTANRSEFINRALVKEKDMHNAVSIKHKGYGYFALNNKVYVLDGNQPKSYVNPQNTGEYSYEWFLWDNINVDCFYSENEELYFGNAMGINKFNTEEVAFSYSDNGVPIKAHWETPITHLSDFSRYKTVADLFTTIMPYSRSGVDIYIKVGSKWVLIDSESMDIFTFFDLDFNRLSFNTNRENSVIATRKIKEKGIILTQLRFENNKAENFGIISSKIGFTIKKELK